MGTIANRVDLGTGECSGQEDVESEMGESADRRVVLSRHRRVVVPRVDVK